MLPLLDDLLDRSSTARADNDMDMVGHDRPHMQIVASAVIVDERRPDGLGGGRKAQDAAAMPGRKLDFYQGFLARARPVFAGREAEEGVELAPCTSCGYPTSSGDMCGVCRIREALKDSK